MTYREPCEFQRLALGETFGGEMRSHRRITLLVSAICLLAQPSARAVVPVPATATRLVCGPSAGATLCLTAPAGSLVGEEVVSATWSGSGSAILEFTLAGAYLNYEYRRPYSFIWPTNKDLDGTYTLAVRVHQGATYGAYVGLTVSLVNGNVDSIPRSPADYRARFTPQTGNTIAAVGNGGAEKPQEVELLNYIKSTDPTAFLYLGEVHEFGSWASRRDHYGLASFDDPAGLGTLWGQMAGYTLPTPGNHERDYIREYRDYWHERPLWSTAVVDGIRMYDLTSECKAHGGCRSHGLQQRWLATKLANNTEPCVLAFWHRPVVSLDPERSGDTMRTAWSMLAKAGGDLVINADTREMEEVLPMNAQFETGQPNSHMVELVSGAAAARWVRSTAPDTRVAWNRYLTPGVVFVRHGSQGLNWAFRDSTGTVLRSGHAGC